MGFSFTEKAVSCREIGELPHSRVWLHLQPRSMKFSIITALLSLSPVAEAFVAPSPYAKFVRISSRPVSEPCKMMVSPEHSAEAAATLVHSATTLLTVGAADPGTVDAPAWVLPVGALAVVLTAGLIPLVLKVTCALFVYMQPGDDAAKDMQDRDQALWEQNKRK